MSDRIVSGLIAALRRIDSDVRDAASDDWKQGALYATTVIRYEIEKHTNGHEDKRRR